MAALIYREAVSAPSVGTSSGRNVASFSQDIRRVLAALNTMNMQIYPLRIIREVCPSNTTAPTGQKRFDILDCGSKSKGAKRFGGADRAGVCARTLASTSFCARRPASVWPPAAVLIFAFRRDVSKFKQASTTRARRDGTNLKPQHDGRRQEETEGRSRCRFWRFCRSCCRSIEQQSRPEDAAAPPPGAARPLRRRRRWCRRAVILSFN